MKLVINFSHVLKRTSVNIIAVVEIDIHTTRDIIRLGYGVDVYWAAVVVDFDVVRIKNHSSREEQDND